MMIRKYILIFITIWFISSNFVVLAKDTSENSLNEIMSQIGKVMIDLYPLIFRDSPLSAYQNRQVYRLTIRLKTLFKSAEPHIKKKSETYQISYLLLNDYLNTIVDPDNPLSVNQVKNRLSTLSNFCISCHTQDNKFRTLFKGNQYNIIKSSFAKAEFNYATRNYLEAHKYYEKYLLLSPKLNNSNILQTLSRIISIYTQILNQPKEAISALDNLTSGRSFPKDINKYISEAKVALSELETLKMNEKSLVPFSELGKHASEYLRGLNASQPIIYSTPKEEVERMWLRGLLFRYLNNDPKPDEMPYILYWLALCDRALGYGYDYTLADFYIQQCIIRYPKHPLARQCFDEHKDYLNFYYTTPTEPVIPFEVNEVLKELENHLQ